MLKRIGKMQNRRRHSENFSVVCIMVMVLCFFCSLFTAAVFAAGNEAGTEVRVIVLDQNEQPAKPEGGNGGGSGDGDNRGNKNESTAGEGDQAGDESGEKQSGNVVDDGSENVSGNPAGGGSLNQNSEKKTDSSVVRSRDGNAAGAVTDNRNTKEGIGADDEKGSIDHESRDANADSAKTGAVDETGQNTIGCRCIWALLFGTCVICRSFHHCLRWWCWIIPLLLSALLFLWILGNRKKCQAERKSH